MFHQINNKKRFALDNNELNLKKFNQFFYKHEDIMSFDIIQKKWIIEDADDEFFKKHIFCRLPIINPINNKISISQIILYFLKKYFKKTLILIFKKFFQKYHRQYIPTLKFHKIQVTDLFAHNSLNSTFTKKNVKSQHTGFFFLKNSFKKEFFKQKVQSKNHSFFKTIINIDIFTKKLLKNEWNFLHNLKKEHYETEKLHLFLNFNVDVSKAYTCEYGFYKIYKNKKKMYKNINITYSKYPVENFLNLMVNFDKSTKPNFMNIKTLKKSNFSAKIDQSFSNNIQNMYLYNLLKLLSDRNNFLTSEYSNSNLTNFFKNFSNHNTQNSLNYLPNFTNKYIMNNFLPYYNFNVKSNFYKNVILRNILNPNFSLYYSYYFFNFLEKYLNKKIWLKINTKSNSIISPKINMFIQDVFNKNRSDQFSVGRHFYLLEFLEIMYISLYYRDLKFFSYWFKKIMEKLHLKKHRKLIKVIQNTLKNNLEFLNLLNVHGFTMDVRGKLGTTGNSKKKHYAFTVGTMSPTSKNHDMSLNQTTVRTSTGVLGVTITLSY